MKVYIGTSGWQYGDWREFYPKTLESWAFLPFYAHNFNSVEINVSFYRMLKKRIFEGWSHVERRVPGFCYSVKLNNHFTRQKKLDLNKSDIAQLKEFLENSAGLGKTLGPILCQLPPSLSFNLELLEKFLKTFFVLAKKISPAIRLATEFRHKSWLQKTVYSLLKEYNTAFVISDSARWPTEAIKTSNFVYIRLHGKPRMFYSLYSQENLREWAAKIAELKPKEAFIYFNNTMRGHAAENALEFKKIAAENLIA